MWRLKARFSYWLARKLFHWRWCVRQPRLWRWMEGQFARMANLGDTDAQSFYGHILAFRGQGLGEHLVQAVVSLAEQEPETKVIELTVSANSDAALALYQRCGFEQSGLEDSAIRVGEAYYDRVHMRRLVNVEEN